MTEATLPGLETIEPVLPVTERAPWIERGPQKRLMLYSGRSNPELAEQIADKLGVHLGDVKLKTFANGETYVRYLDSIRGADGFIVMPLPCEGTTAEQALVALGKDVWPLVKP
jgi:ribose-phosphate pyrophosphokinase